MFMIAPLLRRAWPAVCLALLLGALTGAGKGGTAPAPAASGDAGFAQRHPRLFFSASDLPLLYARVHDGGTDDVAYAFIRQQVTDVYPTVSLDSLLNNDAAQEPIINLALASHLEASVDSAAVNLGRRLTLYIARTFDVDTDPYLSSLRLRALSIGFDHFFVNATPEERDEIRAEAQSYIDYMTTNINYDIWRHRPYTSNKTAMVSAALGLAAISFKDELPSADTDAALATAASTTVIWRNTHLADDGCYREGSLYATWSMRNLVYYFAARKRYDGNDYSLDPAIRAMERWLPYELDPRGGGRANNIQDQTDYYLPLARHTSYWVWAESQWNSGIAAYMFDHCADVYGHDMQDENDKAATVLWYTNVAPVNPGTVLPRSHVWEDRGLYYFRTGWPDGASSDDVVFSLYSGEFHGGHAQEDQNQFTLTAYGEKLVLDHGSGPVAKQSEAHNLVLIDGQGEYNAGASIGTDGSMTDFITTDYADFVRGDATRAYTTHSPYNDDGVPYAWSNWNWGLYGANPVLRAWRTVVAMHGDGIPPYFVISDDIQKDEATHHYDWCMHVPATASIDTTGEATDIDSGNATLRLYCLQPPRGAVTLGVTPFDAGNQDPNSQVLMVGANAVDPHFTMVLMPLATNSTPPDVTRKNVVGGAGITVSWGNDVIDEIQMLAPSSPAPAAVAVPDPFPWTIDSDAAVAVVRKQGPSITGFTLVDATRLTVGGVLLAAIDDGAASLVFDGTRVTLNRPDAQFRLLANLVKEVYYRDTPVPAYVSGDYLVSDMTSAAGAVPASELRVRIYPNPFNPEVHVSFVTPERGMVTAGVYDVGGRLVTTLWSGVAQAGEHTLPWSGRDRHGRDVASGVYFLRVRTGRGEATTKMILLR